MLDTLAPTDLSLGFLLTLAAILIVVTAATVRPHTIAGKVSLAATIGLTVLVATPYVLAISGKPLFALAVWIDLAWISPILACAAAVGLFLAAKQGETRPFVYLATAGVVPLLICGAAPLAG